MFTQDLLGLRFSAYPNDNINLKTNEGGQTAVQTAGTARAVQPVRPEKFCNGRAA